MCASPPCACWCPSCAAVVLGLGRSCPDGSSGSSTSHCSSKPLPFLWRDQLDADTLRRKSQNKYVSNEHAAKGPRPGVKPRVCTWDAHSINWANWRPTIYSHDVEKKSLEFLTNLAGMLSNDGFIKKSPMNIYVCILTGFFNPKMSAHIWVLTVCWRQTWAQRLKSNYLVSVYCCWLKL